MVTIFRPLYSHITSTDHHSSLLQKIITAVLVLIGHIWPLCQHTPYVITISKANNGLMLSLWRKQVVPATLPQNYAASPLHQTPHFSNIALKALLQ